MQLHIFGENKSYKHFFFFYQQRLAYKNQKVCQSDRRGRRVTQTDTGLGSSVDCDRTLINHHTHEEMQEKSEN